MKLEKKNIWWRNIPSLKIRFSDKNIRWRNTYVTYHFLLVTKKFCHISFFYWWQKNFVTYHFFIGDETFSSPIHKVTELRWRMLFRHLMYSWRNKDILWRNIFVIIAHFCCSEHLFLLCDVKALLKILNLIMHWIVSLITSHLICFTYSVEWV